MNARSFVLVLSVVLAPQFLSSVTADEPKKQSGGISLELNDKSAAKKKSGGISLELDEPEKTTPKKNTGGISLELVDKGKTTSESEIQLAEQSADRFAALAYSSSTRRYGYAHNYGSAQEAKAAAIKYCGTADARIVAWTKNGYIAVARGHAGAIGWGWAQDPDTAVSYAHANCLRYSSVSNIVVLVSAKK